MTNPHPLLYSFVWTSKPFLSYVYSFFVVPNVVFSSAQTSLNSVGRADSSRLSVYSCLLNSAEPLDSSGAESNEQAVINPGITIIEQTDNSHNLFTSIYSLKFYWMLSKSELIVLHFIIKPSKSQYATGKYNPATYAILF